MDKIKLEDQQQQLNALHDGFAMLHHRVHQLEHQIGQLDRRLFRLVHEVDGAAELAKEDWEEINADIAKPAST